MLTDEIEKIEQEKNQLSQDKETCRQKLEDTGSIFDSQQMYGLRSALNKL